MLITELLYDSAETYRDEIALAEREPQGHPRACSSPMAISKRLPIENRHHQQTHADNFLCIPPLYHTGAKMHWLGNFMVGAKAVILKGGKAQMDPGGCVRRGGLHLVWLLVPWALDILLARIKTAFYGWWTATRPGKSKS